MAWSSSVGSSSWTGGTRKYSSISAAQTGGKAVASKNAGSSSKTGGGGVSSSTLPTQKNAPVPPPPSLISSKTQALTAASYQASRAQQALRSGNYALYIRSMTAYNQAMKDFSAASSKGGGGSAGPAPIARSLTIVDREGTPVRRFTVTDKTVDVSSRSDLIRYGVKTPGTYTIRSMTQENIPRKNYYAFGTGLRIPVERDNFKPSPSPVLTVAIENAFGMGPRLVSSSTEVKPASWALGKDRLLKTDVYESRSGAQSQLFMMAAGKSSSESAMAGFSPVRFTVSTPSVQPSETWRLARETKGWRVLTDTFQRPGYALEDFGTRMANRASERWVSEGRPTSGLSAVGSRLQYDVGSGLRFGGQWLAGLGTGIREEPGRTAVAVGVGVLTGATGKALGTWASLGGTAAGLTNFGFKGVLAVAGGYYGASEFDAIRKAERPGERFALTTLDVAGFGFGAALGSSFVPSPSVTGVRVTSTKGILTETDMGLRGQIVRKGSVSSYWFGKSWKTSFTATESFSGGQFSGLVKYGTGVSSSYSGSLVKVSPQGYGPTRMLAPGGTQTILFRPKGAEFTTLTRSGLSGFDVRGRTTGFGEKNMVFIGSSDKGRGAVSVFMRGPAPTRGFLTYATGEAATVFQPGSFSGVGVFPAYDVSPVGIASFSPSLPAVPSFGAIARGFSVPESYGFLGLSSVESRAKSVFSAQSMAISPVLSSASSMTGVMAFPVAGVASGSIVEPVTSSVVESGSVSVPDSRTVIGFDYGGGGSVDPFPPPPVEPPLVPFDLGPPALGFGYGRKSWSGRGSVNFKTRYNPSLVGVDFRIRGSAAAGRAAALTGIAVRPIV